MVYPAVLFISRRDPIVLFDIVFLEHFYNSKRIEEYYKIYI